MSIHKVEHTGIRVSDMQKSIAFYQSVFGLMLQSTWGEHNGGPRLAFLGFEGRPERENVELIATDARDIAETGRVDHLAFTVTDLDAEVARIRALNVRFIDEAPTALADLGRVIFFYGPDGEHLELFERQR
jgi:lactoylglutathione lyase